jgi:hypothetical protein
MKHAAADRKRGRGDAEQQHGPPPPLTAAFAAELTAEFDVCVASLRRSSDAEFIANAPMERIARLRHAAHCEEALKNAMHRGRLDRSARLHTATCEARRQFANVEITAREAHARKIQEISGALSEQLAKIARLHKTHAAAEKKRARELTATVARLTAVAEQQELAAAEELRQKLARLQPTVIIRVLM